MYNGAGQYIIAGVDTFSVLYKKWISTHGDYISNQQLSDFLNNTVDRFLLSYGTALNYKSKKLPADYSEKITKNLREMVLGPEFMKDKKIYIDSGGFQISQGAIHTKDMPEFMKMYHQFLTDNYDYYSHAFLLDIPPGPGSEDIFSTWDQVEQLNKESYQMSASMPQKIKDKMIYIHHFRTPSIFKIFSKYLWEDNLAEGYNYFGTGGIVVNAASDLTIPVIVYTIPLASILRYAIQKGLKSFKFHILGGAGFAEVFYHKLFSYHIKQFHNIDVEITYDSSALFKGLIIGRYIPVLTNEKNLIKLDLRSNQLHLRFDNTTINGKAFEVMNDLTEYGFKKLDQSIDSIYDPITDTFSTPAHMYLIAHYLKFYREIEELSTEVVKTIYPLYKSGMVAEFDAACIEFTKKINAGKVTRKQKAKTYSLHKSLKVLESLDEEYNMYLVSKFMTGSDLSYLQSGSSIKF
jgi:hypothetical protein